MKAKTSGKATPYSGWFWASERSPEAHLPGIKRQGVLHTACGLRRGRRVPRKTFAHPTVLVCIACVRARWVYAARTEVVDLEVLDLGGSRGRLGVPVVRAILRLHPEAVIVKKPRDKEDTDGYRL